MFREADHGAGSGHNETPVGDETCYGFDCVP
jgi:hypothetical protein